MTIDAPAPRSSPQTVSPTFPQTFPKSVRVRKRSDYLAVQGSGRKLTTPSFLVFVRSRGAEAGAADPGAASLPARFGVTVTRKIGGATVRNRIKRLVREAVRRHKMWFPAGRDVVLVARRPAADLHYTDVERELETLWRRYFARS